MSIGSDTFAWRRDLPHLQKVGKTYFVTFCSDQRRVLTPSARDAALASCLCGHHHSYFLHTAVIMPDHVHLIFTLYDQTTLPATMKLIKSTSSRRIGRGTTWQREYFDRAVRSDEDLRAKCEYVAANPVRAGLVRSVDEYPWVWRWWVEGKLPAPVRTPAPH
ncbi:MAG TPA: transposase [Thermoanaerobaculia bacterium]